MEMPMPKHRMPHLEGGDQLATELLDMLKLGAELAPSVLPEEPDEPEASKPTEEQLQRIRARKARLKKARNKKHQQRKKRRRKAR